MTTPGRRPPATALWKALGRAISLPLSYTTIRGTTGVSSVTVIEATTSNGDLAVMTQRP